MPTVENQQKILAWFDANFTKTKIAVGCPYVGKAGNPYKPGGPAGWITNTDFGLHDDSFG